MELCLSCFWLTLVHISLVLGSESSCGDHNEQKHNCNLTYMKLPGGYKELLCPFPADLKQNITWYFKENLHENWTSVDLMKFCKCSDCKPSKCKKTSKGALRMSYGSFENEGFYKCSNGTKESEHCFEMKMYNCNKDNYLYFGPPDEIPTLTGSQLNIKCGANFGCEKEIIASIDWEHNSHIINDSLDRRYHLCHRKNITNIDSELIIKRVVKDDFHYPFICKVKLGNKIKTFSVTILSADPKVAIIDNTKQLMFIVQVTVTVILLLTAFMALSALMFLKPQRFFCILKHCSWFGRLAESVPYRGQYKYDIFILHDGDDVSLARSVHCELQHYGYRIILTDDIEHGLDFLKEFKDLIQQCHSLIVIYPKPPIITVFDHELVAGKQFIKPWHVSLLVHGTRQTIYGNDVKFQNYSLKKFVFDTNNHIHDMLSWRIPKSKTQHPGRVYAQPNHYVQITGSSWREQ